MCSLYYAYSEGSTSCVREMLKDSRVNPNEPHNNGCTPLWGAALRYCLDVIKWWIASGREVDAVRLKLGLELQMVLCHYMVGSFLLRGEVALMLPATWMSLW